MTVITSRRPEDVAIEVDRLRAAGETHFVIARIDGGGTLDQERLGAARYAGELESAIELEETTPAAAAAAR